MPICKSVYKEAAAAYLLYQLEIRQRLYLLVNTLYIILMLPVILIWTRLAWIPSVMYLIGCTVYRCAFKRKLLYIKYVMDFADGWATFERRTPHIIAVTSRGSEHLFTLAEDDSVDDTDLHVEFIKQLCFVHPSVVKALPVTTK